MTIAFRQPTKTNASALWAIRLLSVLFSVLGLSAACSSPPDVTAAINEDAPAPASVETIGFDDSELRCLALSMYWEAKAEGSDGMLAVGHVVLNRVEHAQFPNAPCAVVFDGGETPPCQFSWYCDGKSDQPTEAANWANAQRLARQLVVEELTDTTGGALFFHGKQIKNPWRVPRTKTVTVGNHVFYKL